QIKITIFSSSLFLLSFHDQISNRTIWFHHRHYQFFVFYNKLDQRRAVFLLPCFFKGRDDLFLFKYSDSLRAVTFCKFDKIRRIWRTLGKIISAEMFTALSPSQAGSCVFFAVEQILPLAYHSEISVI